MKKIVGLLLLILLWGCKKDDVPAKLDLNGTFVGTVTGWSQPSPINGSVTWVVTHIGDEITANITYYAGSPGGVPKYKGKIVNDTTLIGGFIDIPAVSIVNGKISKDGNRITCATASSDPTYNYFRVSFDLTRK
jgi:hypothetical protein